MGVEFYVHLHQSIPTTDRRLPSGGSWSARWIALLWVDIRTGEHLLRLSEYRWWYWGKKIGAAIIGFYAPGEKEFR